MNTIRNIGLILAYAASTTGTFGCAASLPPQDLLNARTAYENASRGPAVQLDPAGMHVAKEQLNLAEKSFTENGDTQGTRDQAYLAMRKTELSEVVARTMAADQKKDGVVNAMHQDEKRTVALTAAELARQKSQFATQGAAMKAQGAELSAQGVQLQDEKTKRLDAEKRAAQAAADLAKFASVKQEARGMVITLSGSVLFASAKWDLLPEAQLKLNEVANALIKEDPLSTMVVEGHTDSQGGATYNQDLSQHRAMAVRDYLVSRGIASDRITGQGFGFSRSVADNASPEGRANNRRVEIVVKPATPAN